ncbi:sulfatase-like hydrolase/transferase [Seonamhaeicola sp.]|uniref:sulfatase family protein n=1 Tax=Seonamhaeicola sp. TaxID=1912245 RepID=UPI002619A7ED|nr:sulfatase-like hydrolase/transferase [Seonamhaeicola sp.]
MNHLLFRVRYKTKYRIAKLFFPLFLSFLFLSSCNKKKKELKVSNVTTEFVESRSNIIFIMADDLGWGDVGFNGNKTIKTPNLDQMAQNGLQLNRFYASSPVCSPTRGSCLTGRHPYRYGVYFAMQGHAKPEEVLIPEVLKEHGYATGHFGKWHLGTLTKEDQNRWGGWAADPKGNFSPPWKNGYDTCFVTESKVPTWNPMVAPKGSKKPLEGEPFGNDYWIGPEQKATTNLDGDDSRVIMDRVLPFIENAVNNDKPFFSAVWFHTPHAPVVAGPEYRAMYSDYSEGEQHYYGCITAMDEQIGRLRNKLKELGVDKNTMIWFCSDNGPEGRELKGTTRGLAGPFRGRKRDLLEGGVRVPAVLVWPEKIKNHAKTDIPMVTSDYFPTVMDMLGIHKDTFENPVDGISLLPIINGEQTTRNMPIGFKSKKQRAWMTEEYKIYSNDKGETFSLYHLPTDLHEDQDLAAKYPEKIAVMKTALEAWEASCEASDQGGDYK